VTKSESESASFLAWGLGLDFESRLAAAEISESKEGYYSRCPVTWRDARQGVTAPKPMKNCRSMAECNTEEYAVVRASHRISLVVSAAIQGLCKVLDDSKALLGPRNRLR